MTQPANNNTDGGGTPAAEPAAPATGTGQAPTPTPATTPPPPPGFVPAGGGDGATQPAPAAGEGDPNQLGDAGKRALEAERERAKKAEAAAKAEREQIAALKKQLDDLQPAAELFAQFRKAAVPEAEKTETEKLQERLAAMEAESRSERRQRWLLEIIQDHNLTRDDIRWLHGETREELESAAEALAKRLAATKPAPAPEPAPEPAANGDQPAGEPQPTTTPPAQTAPKPDPSQGARGPVDIHAQIEDAMAKGDVRRSIALKQQLAAQGQNQ